MLSQTQTNAVVSYATRLTKECEAKLFKKETAFQESLDQIRAVRDEGSDAKVEMSRKEIKIQEMDVKLSV